MLSHNLKAEMSTYIDQSMKQWEFEYRRDHGDAMKRFNDVLAMSKHILPKSTFNVSEIKLKINTLNAIFFFPLSSNSRRSRASLMRQ